MTHMQGKDDEHFASESGDRDQDQSPPVQQPDPQHVKDDEHYAPES